MEEEGAKQAAEQQRKEQAKLQALKAAEAASAAIAARAQQQQAAAAAAAEVAAGLSAGMAPDAAAASTSTACSSAMAAATAASAASLSVSPGFVRPPAQPPLGAAASSSAAPGATGPGPSGALPDELDRYEASYFDAEDEAIDGSGAGSSGDAGGRASSSGGSSLPRFPNGLVAANGQGGALVAAAEVGEGGVANGRHSAEPPGSADSTVVPDERADALEAYMRKIEAERGALAAGAPPEDANSRVVLLEHLLTAAMAADPNELHQTRMETGHECERWGRLLRVHAVAAFDDDAKPVAEGVAGRIFVEFAAAEAAAECARAMDGRFFDGRRVSATFYPLDAFFDGDFSQSGAELKQTAITWDDIVAMNSRPASSWDTMAAAAGASGGGGGGGGATAAAAEDVPPGQASSAMEVDAGEGASSSAAAAAARDDGAAAAAAAAEEPSNFHEEFMKQMRATAAEAARRAAHASAEVLEGQDDSMDALVEEFPDVADNAAPISDDEDDEDKAESALQARAKKKELPKVDHSQMSYASFRKSFYIEVPELKNMSDEEVEALRKSMDGIKVRGKRCPKPIKRWTQSGLSDRLLAAIDKAGYVKPFPIQAQCVPAVMSGRDVIAIAKTGSGKTMGYALPMLRHVMDQPPLANGDGPIALVMVPTRELAMQVYREISKFAKVAGCAAAAIYGGSNLKQQIAELKRGAEIVVCTPGRMIDMLTANSGRVTNLRRVTYVVLDEADRMFDMGFAPQIDRIVQNTRPDRQTMLFSATFPQAVEKLARTVLTKPVQIVVGGISVVSSTIDQHVEVMSTDAKLPRLCQLLRHHYDEGQQLVFVDTQEACDALFRELLKQNLPCATLHGGMGQDDRDSTIADFKSGDVSLLIATSVAARGLDVKGLVCVINYEVPNHYEDYVHRVGRTGRAGNTGTAYTFLTPDEEKYAPDLVKAMEAAGQEAPDEVVCMANAYQAKRQAGELQSKDFRTSGFKSGKGFAFDAESLAKDEKSKREARNRAKRAAGVDLGDGDSEDDDDKVQIKVIGGDPAQRAELTGEGGIEQSVAEAAAKAAAKLAAVIKAKGGTVPSSSSKGSSGGGAPAAAAAGGSGAEAMSASLAAAAAAGAAALTAAATSGGIGAAAPSQSMPAQQAAMNAADAANQARIASLPLATQKALAAAQAKAAEVAQRAGLAGQTALGGQLAAGTLSGALSGVGPAESLRFRPARFTAELEVNDYPQQARFKVMNKEVLSGIQEFTKAAIIAKGSYYPPGRNPPPGERKLYFFIEAESEANVKAARKELKRSLDEAAAVAAPAEESRYGKYKI